MDGKGRATDNICIERFWRSIKYEEIYLNEYKNMKVLNRAIKKYMDSYNRKRLHSAIDYKTPNEVYWKKRTKPATPRVCIRPVKTLDIRPP